MRSVITLRTVGAGMTNLSLLDHQNFEARVAPQRSELLAHCYRMMGSLSDAEDLVQETLLRAWRRRDTYVEDASLRAWLYRIATNACLDALKQRRRRVIPLNYEEESSAADPIPPAVSDPIWLEPFPDALLAPLDQHPEGRLLIRETLSIAFMAALQLLTPRQRAVLLLSDVLDWSDAEIADLLGTSVSAVKSALHRARAGTAEAKLLPTRANGQITFGLYRQAESGGWRAYGIQVLTPFEYQIADIITFRDPALAARFGLPDTV